MKEYIFSNPYRILGLNVEATQREIAKRVSDIEVYEAMGKSFSSEYDRVVPGKISRTDSTLAAALSKLEMDDSRLLYSLFWFGTSEYDDSNSEALKSLLGGEEERAHKVWRSATKEQLTYKNATSYKNYSVYLIHLSVADDQLDLGLFMKGISYACEFLNSNYFEDYSWTVNGSEYSLNRAKIYRAYCDWILESISKDERTSSNVKRAISALDPLGFDAIEYAVDVFTRDEVRRVEESVLKAKQLRDESPKEANKWGKQLASNVNGTVRILKSLFPADDLRYQIIADKFSDELLQCSIHYFNSSNEEVDFQVDDSIKLLNYSAQFAASERLKDKIKENDSFISEWKASAADRAKFKLVKDEIEFIHNKITGIDLNIKFSEVPLAAIKLINSCKPKLYSIKSALGSRDDTYKQFTDAVADNALGICAMLLNAVGEEINKHYEFTDYERQSVINETIESIIPVLNKIGGMDISTEMRNQYKEFCDNLGVQTTC